MGELHGACSNESALGGNCTKVMTRPDGVSSQPFPELSETDAALGLWEIALCFSREVQ